MFDLKGKDFFDSHGVICEMKGMQKMKLKRKVFDLRVPHIVGSHI